MFRVCLLLSALLFVATAAGAYFGFCAFPINWDLKWHAGKSRTEWLMVIDDGTPLERDDAIEAMVVFGDVVIDDLVQKLREGNVAAREATMTALAKIGEPALEPLRKAHHDPRYAGLRPRFQEALIRVGPPAAQHVATWLESPSVFDQRLALLVLSHWSVGPELVLSRLGQLMNNDEEAHGVIQLLARLGKPGVEPLLKYLRSDKSDTRIAALLALGEMGHNAKSALPALQDLREDSDDNQVTLVDQTILKIEEAKQ